ncbi:MAG: hypothetical protein HY901_35575 [Deltaproteobacteria bacterium]|nr:hypothetical protein [Deltaproteobacteria bacterium]
MTLNEFFLASYSWADLNAAFILAVAVLLPLTGTVLAYIGKGGRTDTDGRFVASAVMAMAIVGVLGEVVAIFVARGYLGVSVFDANLLLLVAPIVCLAGAVLGIRLVFPLSQLGSVRTATDLGLFLAACGGIVWMLSKFRGWSVVFLGSFLQLLLIGAVALFLLLRLYRRAFGQAGSTRPAMESSEAGAGLRTGAGGSPLLGASLAIGVVALSAGALFGFWQFTRPSSEQRTAPSSAVTAEPTRAPRATPSAYSYIDERGLEHLVQRLEEVPERYRPGAKPIE